MIAHDAHKTVLEAVYVDLDPVLDGFEGAVVELSREGGVYTLTETAAGSGNRLMRFSSEDSSLARELFRRYTAPSVS